MKPISAILLALATLSGCIVGEGSSSEASGKLQGPLDAWLDPSNTTTRLADVELTLAWDGSSASIYAWSYADHYVYVDVSRLTLWCDDASNPSIGSYIDTWPGDYTRSQVIRCRDNASVISLEAHVAVDP